MRTLKILYLLLVSILVSACGKETFQHVDIYFTADSNGFYASRRDSIPGNGELGGYGILKNFLNTREEPYLLFDGGNWFGSVPESALTKGAFITPFLKEIPYTAGTVTAGDFVHGWPSLRAIIKELPTPFVAANLRLERTLPWPLHDYQIRTVGDLKIGIFGLVNLSGSSGRETQIGVRVLDPIQTAQEMVSLLKEKEVNYIILLSSLGVPSDQGVGDPTLAQEVDGIDLILSSAQDRPHAEREIINQTQIIYPKSQLESVSHIRVLFDKNKQIRGSEFEDIPLLKSTYGEDNLLADVAAQLREQVSEKMSKKVSTVPQKILTSLTEESPLGALLAQCVHTWAKLDGALLNASSIRSNLEEGDLMEYDVYRMYPYADNITYVTMKGSALKQALQNSLNAADNFPQLAGMTVEYVTTPAGKLVQKVTLANGRIVRADQTYRLAVTDYILAGGFGHDAFINALEFKNTFVEARHIMRMCLLRQKQVVPPPTNHFKEVK